MEVMEKDQFLISDAEFSKNTLEWLKEIAKMLMDIGRNSIKSLRKTHKFIDKYSAVILIILQFVFQMWQDSKKKPILAYILRKLVAYMLIMFNGLLTF